MINKVFNCNNNNNNNDKNYNKYNILFFKQQQQKNTKIRFNYSIIQKFNYSLQKIYFNNFVDDLHFLVVVPYNVK
jgi:hypothetical protein